MCRKFLTILGVLFAFGIINIAPVLADSYCKCYNRGVLVYNWYAPSGCDTGGCQTICSKYGNSYKGEWCVES